MSENIKFKANRQGIRLARAAIVRDDAILLVAFDGENGFHYNLPGGGVEPGERLYDAARREAREETAAEVEVKELSDAILLVAFDDKNGFHYNLPGGAE